MSQTEARIQSFSGSTPYTLSAQALTPAAALQTTAKAAMEGPLDAARKDIQLRGPS
jgi:hypothetical protein